MLPFEPTLETLVFVAAVYVVAGVVKGVIGMGMPLITIPLLATTIGPITAMALLTVPAIVVNIWQAYQSRYLVGAYKRFRICYVLLALGVAIGVTFVTRMDAGVLTALLGVVVIGVSLSQLFPLRLYVSEIHERRLTPAVGFASGLLGGISMMFGPLMAIYLVALRLDKDQFVGAIALFYLVASVPFATGLAVYGRLGKAELIASFGAAAMIFLGVFLGQWLRGRTSQEVFRKVVLVFLLLIGLNMIRKGLLG